MATVSCSSGGRRRGRRSVEVDEPFGVVDRAADQPERHRQAEPAGAQGAGGGAADSDPDRQGPDRLRVGGHVLQRWADPSGPGHPVLAAESQQQVELLSVEVIDQGNIFAEKGERFGERAAAGDDLGPPVTDQVEGGEILIDPNRIQDAQHGRGRGERNPAGRPGDRGVHHGGRGHGERAGVVLTDPEHVQAVLLGQDAVADDVVDPAGRGVGAAGVDVGE
jgi:hypothetical protein